MSEKKERQKKQHNPELLTNTALMKECLRKWQLNTSVSDFCVMVGYKSYWCTVDDTKLQINDSTIELSTFAKHIALAEIANCSITILYSQVESGSEECIYYLEIAQSKTKRAKSAFTAKQLASKSDFKQKIMATLSGAIYTGNTEQLNSIFLDQAPLAKTVKTIPYIGYFTDIQAYIYNDYAVYQGEIYQKNTDDFFVLPHCYVKSTFDLSNFDPSIDYKNEWLEVFIEVFGDKGLVALSYWMLSLFAEQIRYKYGMFPFLEVTGDAGAGKSLLIEFLWALVGRSSYEGINPTTSTRVGRSRTLAQVSNLPVVFIEGDINDPNSSNKHKQKTFSPEELKPLFNGRSPRTKANKDHTNITDDEPFKGSVVISQNQKVSGSEAILSRLVYLHFDRSQHSAQSREAASYLARLSVEEVSGFLFYVLKNEQLIMDIVDRTFQSNRDHIMALPNVKMERIGSTHGLMLSGLQALSEILPITDNTKQKVMNFIDQIAIERERDLVSDHPALDQFWDVYDYFESLVQPNQPYSLNHSPNEDEIAIHLNEFFPHAKLNHQALEDIKLIKKIIKTSMRHPFIAVKTVRSLIASKPMHCYIFKK
ncbi:hypothetical protein [Wohlfahrtiimonas chitiniclastica]|uniref:hypothetical protein n=1 Tax=Wohlfahrtiimonas chitiniclastica TaxID=400946 RepID=UPI000B9912BC|nr:hypothetical protein [Wohlfahrtiimonas chitiniclastica]OYQ75956.1 hypothetical protein B9T18_00955 [Wohlfahrtiimonas chitiniclastica]